MRRTALTLTATRRKALGCVHHLLAVVGVDAVLNGHVQVVSGALLQMVLGA
jgi:hypothetical protein